MRKKIVGPGDTVPGDDVPLSSAGPEPFEGSKGDPEQHPGARIVGADASLEDEVYGATLRPRTFADYVGQEQIVDNLRIAIDAAARRGEPLEHVLFSGPPGLGKTTLANLIARATGGTLRPTSGPTLEKPKDLVGILTALEAGDVLFIDEIHRLGTVVEEYLYPAMEDFQIDFVVDRGAYAKTLKLPLKRFTLVGATTRAGMLSAPLRDRFGIVHHLEYYEPAELQRIVERSARVLDIAMETAGARTIAARSRGTPRIANRLLRRVRDFAEVRAGGVITAEVADEALRREGVDALGLDRLDRAYLETIAKQYGGGPVGIDAIAATLTEDVETLEDVVEPYLLKIGFVQRTAQGRKTTPAALAHLGLRDARRRAAASPVIDARAVPEKPRRGRDDGRDRRARRLGSALAADSRAGRRRHARRDAAGRRRRDVRVRRQALARRAVDRRHARRKAHAGDDDRRRPVLAGRRAAGVAAVVAGRRAASAGDRRAHVRAGAAHAVAPVRRAGRRVRPALGRRRGGAPGVDRGGPGDPRPHARVRRRAGVRVLLRRAAAATPPTSSRRLERRAAAVPARRRRPVLRARAGVPLVARRSALDRADRRARRAHRRHARSAPR